MHVQLTMYMHVCARAKSLGTQCMYKGTIHIRTVLRSYTCLSTISSEGFMSCTKDQLSTSSFQNESFYRGYMLERMIHAIIQRENT